MTTGCLLPPGCAAATGVRAHHHNRTRHAARSAVPSALAFMAQEIPGIYLRTDIDRLYVFDSVEAKVVKRDASGVTLEITNPTSYDAKVSIFAENATRAANLPSSTAFLKWPKAEVKSGASKTITITADGKLN